MLKFIVALSLLTSVAFAQIKTQQIPRDEIQQIWNQLPVASKDASKPYILDHNKVTTNSVLLLHGLSDSPYYVRQIGEVFYKKGWNVVAILYRGHGTKAEDLKYVKVKEWRADVQNGIKIAKLLGQNVSIGGFSTGATLAIEALLNKSAPFQSLYLFSPAIGFYDKMAYLSCIVKPFMQYDEPDAIENSDVRYRKIAINSVCQLRKVMKSIRKFRRADEIKVPVFTVITDADTTISPKDMHKFANRLETQKYVITYPAELKIAHGAVTRSETNSKFNELKTELNKFIQNYFKAE
ncbi:MAG: alpha/beta hydrolase [Bacteriovoracaceae bacterium]|nr:alpha/beta hydrolase [Bacteriovoracaceae bacterium]